MRLPLCLLTALALSLPRAAHAQPAPSARPVSLGLSGLIGSREAERGGSTPTWTAGVDASVGLGTGFALAFRRLTVGAARTLDGDRWAIGVSPALELHADLGRNVEPFVQFGAALQTRFGDGRQDVRFGVAPFIDAGLRFYLGQVRGQDVSLLEVFRGWPWLLPIFLGNLLVGLAAVASILLLFIPMVVLGLGWMFWQAFVVDEDMGAVDALTASWRLTKGSKVDLFVFGLVVGMLNLAGVLLCGLGLVVTIPLSGLASMMVYDNLRVVGPKEV